MKLSQIKANPNNPRLIKDDKFKKLVKSIQEFPSPSEFVKLIEGVKCPIKSTDEEGEVQIDTFGSFRVKEVVNLNFGSVQIYVATPYLKTYVTE